MSIVVVVSFVIVIVAIVVMVFVDTTNHGKVGYGHLAIAYANRCINLPPTSDTNREATGTITAGRAGFVTLEGRALWQRYFF